MMENKLVQRFINEVNEVISSEHERDTLFDALRSYQESSDVKSLVSDLQHVLNEPARLEIYEYVRPLVRPQHQQQYDRMAPSAPGQKLRVIRLRRRQNENLGFAVRGGFEHNIGVFVSHVDPGSQAEQHGLKVGDEIVRVNGFTISEAIHEEVLNLIKGKDEIELKVTNIGMIPIKQNPNDPVTWQYVEKIGNTRPQVQGFGDQAMAKQDEVKIFINTRGATSLGCTIFSGPKSFPGVFIETVRPGGLAEDYGLALGDQIVKVNGKSFIDIKHEEAIVELKGSKELNMVIRKGAGLPLLTAQKESGLQSHAYSTARNQPSTSYGETDSQDDDSWSPEILENIEAEERRLWEEEQERMRQEREADRVRAEIHQREIERQAVLERQKIEEERRKNEEEKQQRLTEERQKQDEREKEAQRQQEEQEKRKREEEMNRRIERERRRIREEEERKRKAEILLQKQETGKAKQWKCKQKERDFYRRVKLNQKEAEIAKQLLLYDRLLELDALKRPRSAVLAGRAGPVSAMKPALLGAVEPPTQVASSSNVKEVVIHKETDTPLDIEIEGGIDSPLGGKIVVADVYPDGLADKNGEIRRGDQILKVNDKRLENIPLSEAQEILWNAEQDSQDSIKFVIAESNIRNLDDEITYF